MYFGKSNLTKNVDFCVLGEGVENHLIKFKFRILSLNGIQNLKKYH